MNRSAIVGSILGTAVADAIGLPYEGLSRTRAARMLGPPTRYRFGFGRGMVSDDTEHTCMVAESLIASGGNVDAFARQFARRLRWWVLMLPAGIGFATLRATLKLWLGFSPQNSGVFSAGNGPAMRSALLGAAIDDLPRMRALVAASTRLTHTDPRAEVGAMIVAYAAWSARRSASVDGHAYVSELRELLTEPGSESFLARIDRVVASVEAGQSTQAFAEAEGMANGISGFVEHTVPAAIHAWLRNQQDYRGGVMEMIACGGDADTTAAIVGGIIGTSVGKDGIPREWLRGLADWPRTVTWMEGLGYRLASVVESRQPERPPRLPLSGLLLRNLVFLLAVLFHGFRRLAPPY